MHNILERKHTKPVDSHPLKGATKAVYQQLLPDFPAPALEFVKRSEWIGPVEVPRDEIDTAHRATWAASHEPDKVKKHQELIKNGESKPIVLVKIPGNDKLVIIDAHHRFLAYEAMDTNPIAYIGLVNGNDVEAALTMHAKQYHGGSKLDGTAGEVESGSVPVNR